MTAMHLTPRGRKSRQQIKFDFLVCEGGATNNLNALNASDAKPTSSSFKAATNSQYDEGSNYKKGNRRS